LTGERGIADGRLGDGDREKSGRDGVENRSDTDVVEEVSILDILSVLKTSYYGYIIESGKK
jgi:hypothetical protein